MTSLQVVTATAKEWTAALMRLAPAFIGKPPVSILSSVVIDPSGKLSAYNYTTSAVTSLYGADGSGGPFLADRRWLLDTIRATTGRDKSALVEVSASDDRVTVSACGYELRLERRPLEDYPSLPTVRPKVTSKVNAAELRKSLSRVGSAASKDDTISVLNGIQFFMERGTLRMLSTDRYRLAMDSVPGKGKGQGEFLLPEKTARAWDKHLVGDAVEVGLNGDLISLKTEHVTFTATSIDGDFPKVTTLFYKNAAKSWEVDRAVMLESAKVAALMAERNTPCFIRMTDAGAEVTFNDSLFGLSKAPLAPGAPVIEGTEELRFALNPRYFVDALQRIPTEKVRISCNSAVKPFAINPEGVPSGSEDALNFLVMPVRMPND